MDDGRLRVCEFSFFENWNPLLSNQRLLSEAVENGDALISG